MGEHQTVHEVCKGRFRRAYAGVNASDVNYTAGRYFGGAAAAEKRLPFDAGFESVGVVAALGPGVSGDFPDTAAGTMAFNLCGSTLSSLWPLHALDCPEIHDLSLRQSCAQHFVRSARKLKLWAHVVLLVSPSRHRPGREADGAFP